MADEKKYHWQIGSLPPFIDRHSQTKHAIVEEYVRQYILTLMAPALRPELKLSIIDGFCGGGCYRTEDGGFTDGSPIQMMRAVREARMRLNEPRRIPRRINVDYYFVDVLSDTTNYLRYWLDARHSENAIDLEDYQKVEIITNGFLNELPLLIQKIKLRKGGERVLFILDQYSYKDVPLPAMASVMHNLKGAEIIMTFNVDNLITYIADRAENRKALENIGLDAYIPWEQIKQIKAGREWRQILQRYLAHGIKQETGAKYMTLFFVKPHGTNTWGYWLIHLSNTYRAHAVMKSLHWEHATEFGHELESGVFVLGYDANKDSLYTGQQTFEFGGEGSKEACIEGVSEYFGQIVFQLDKPTPLRDLFENCVTNSTAAEPHLMASVGRLHFSKDVVVVSKDGAKKRPNTNYNLSDIIEPSRQTSLFKFKDD